MSRHPLDFEYERHDGVRTLVDGIRYCLEDVSLGFDRWDEPRVQGPGLYVAVVSGPSVRAFADPMGDDRWPVDESRAVREDLTAFRDSDYESRGREELAARWHERQESEGGEGCEPGEVSEPSRQ